jgi:uncharacterized protein
MILCDTSALIAFLDKSDRHHLAVKAFEQERLIVPSTVLCEVDYMIVKYLGESVAKQFFAELLEEWEVLVFDTTDLARVNQIREFYNSLPLGFVDASLVALAERHRIQRILTLDRRHFLAIQPVGLVYLELLPLEL